MKKILLKLIAATLALNMTSCCAVARLLEDTQRCIENSEQNVRKIKKTWSQDQSSTDIKADSSAFYFTYQSPVWPQ